jgi:hypothetical protein
MWQKKGGRVLAQAAKSAIFFLRQLFPKDGIWCRSPKLKSPTWPDCSAEKKFGFVSFRVCVRLDTKNNRTERIFSERSQSLALGG